MRRRGTLAIVILTLLLSAATAQAKGPITVVFRYDDVCSMSGTDVELRILAAFEKRGIPITFSVMPFAGPFPKEAGQPDPLPLNEAKTWMLRKGMDSGILEVAQHGYSHEDVCAGQSGGSSEFSGQPYDKQFERMARGKRLLDHMLDARITCFVPPWNTYDEQTVRVAKALHISVFSPGGPDAGMEKKYKMPFVGCCASPKTLQQRLEDARKSTDAHPVVTALFHVFQISDYNKQYGEFSFAELESLLDWVKTQRDVKCVTVTRAAKALGNRGCRRPS